MDEANLATGLSELQVAGLTFFGFVIIAIVITAYGHHRRRKQVKKKPRKKEQSGDEQDIPWEDIPG